MNQGQDLRYDGTLFDGKAPFLDELAKSGTISMDKILSKIIGQERRFKANKDDLLGQDGPTDSGLTADLRWAHIGHIWPTMGKKTRKNKGKWTVNVMCTRNNQK